MKIYKRHDPTPLMANPTGEERGPNGRRLCRWCGTETTPPRRLWCSKECVHEYNIRARSSYARACVRHRDKGCCSTCGRNCVGLRKHLRRMPRQCRHTYHLILGLNKYHTNTLWEVDHIIPVVEGGGSCGLENLRTLCIWCHRKETAKLAARRALKRQRKPKPSRGSVKKRKLPRGSLKQRARRRRR